MGASPKHDARPHPGFAVLPPQAGEECAARFELEGRGEHVLDGFLVAPDGRGTTTELK